MMATIRDSRTSNSMAVKTTASIVVSHSTAAITRIPGRPYAVHVNTCIHARNAAANSAGQTRGTRTPDGHSPRRVAATQRAARTVVP